MASPVAPSPLPSNAQSILQPTPLLGGLSPDRFMRTVWQRRPLVVRGAIATSESLLDRRRLFELAGDDDVESRLVVRDGDHWSLRHGPFARRALPPVARPSWTLLVQGVDLHVAAIHELLARFRFVGDARLDDAMVSFASDGGGVGPHVDSYDVFLVQLAGRRRWRVGPLGAKARTRLRDDVPLRMLADFRPRSEWLLEPGDLLYLPPGWGHDGVAEGPCLTCSIGFRAPDAASLGAELLHRLGDARGGAEDPARYADPARPASATPACIPASLAQFGDASLRAAVGDRARRRRALGEWLSEPKASTWFDRREAPSDIETGVVLDARTRMLYDDRHVYVNGEAHMMPAGPDGAALRSLADRRELALGESVRVGKTVRALVRTWIEAGWCHPVAATGGRAR